MNLTIKGGQNNMVSLAELIQIRRGEVTPIGLKHTDSGIFILDGHHYCIIGSTGKGCDLRVPADSVGLFNLKSQTIRQVHLNTLVVPVKAELTIYSGHLQS